MSRIYRLYLQDILTAIKRIEGFAVEGDDESLTSDSLRFDGVLFNLMTIGEAVKNIPDDVKAQYPNIDWRNISRFRDRLVHHYFRIEKAIVLEILKNDLPVLRIQVEDLLRTLNDEPE